MLAAGLTAVVLMFLWNDQASYKPVFGAREKVATADMMTVLEAEHIPYRVHPDSGQVLVPDKSLGKVRMLLAAKGVTAQLPAGLELMDKNDPLGVSQFVQDVRFRRGLEGELAQSIPRWTRSRPPACTCRSPSRPRSSPATATRPRHRWWSRSSPATGSRTSRSPRSSTWSPAASPACRPSACRWSTRPATCSRPAST